MLSKTALHAIHALVALARLPEGTFAGASAIAKEIDAPPNYLGKLLQTLSREGLVISQKGLGGGFCLAKKTEDISIYDVIEPIDHVSKLTGCFMGRATCTDEDSCKVHQKWAPVRDSFLNLLTGTTIAELAQPGDASRKLQVTSLIPKELTTA